MHEARHSKNASQEALSVLFGPQDTIAPQSLLDIRSLLQENADLDFLSRTISELPTLWPAIQEVWPQLNKLPGARKLTELCHFFQGGPSLTFSESTNNLLLSPLTIISQIIDFWKLSHGVDSRPPIESHLGDVQGFCLGFLTATAISCSRNEAQFQALASKAVRLALCMGALVDSDALNNGDGRDAASTVAVRWKSTAHLQHLDRTLNQYPKVSST